MYLDRDMRDRYINEKYDGPRYADDQRHTGGRMPYYDFNEPVARDLREGRSPRARRMYMEGKEMHQGKEV